MPKIAYREINFNDSSLALIRTCNKVIAEYEAQGFTLTLRQLYYQLVSRDIIQNKLAEYKRLGSIVNDARLAGLIDWFAIEDRTRKLCTLSHWESPEEILGGAARGFRMDMWATQKFRPEVWIEKDALIGVIEGVCNELDVPYFSCRGYTSQSEMWAGAMRLKRWMYLDGRDPSRTQMQTPIIFHLGDHDPSGKDMTRDIFGRMELFMGGLKVQRLALNMDQVRQYKPPPNPAKTTDSRYAAYIAQFGAKSWELDALEPRVIASLIRSNVTKLIDNAAWARQEKIVKENRRLLGEAAERWEEVINMLETD